MRRFIKEIDWVEMNGGYIAQLKSGIVRISPVKSDSSYPVFAGQLETLTGSVVATGKFDLEGCKHWARSSLPLLDQVSGKLGDCGNVLETLDQCQRLLSKQIDAVHWLRIEYIKAWMANYTNLTYEIQMIPLPEAAIGQLNWADQSPRFVAETSLGQAVILEIRKKGVIGGGISHRASIVHHTGAELDCFTWLDLMEAEEVIRQQLKTLSQPNAFGYHLDIAEFTLEICKRILPVDSDPIHCARLDNLGVRMFFALG